MTIPTAVLYGYVVVLVRTSGLMVVAPIFSSAVITMKVKIGLLLLLSATITAALPPAPAPVTSQPFVLLLFGEFVIGLAIGFGYRLMMAAVSTAGELIGLNIGLGAASLFDYNSGQNAALSANLYTVVFTMLFISMDGHHRMLLVLRESYSVLAAGEMLQRVPAPTEIMAQISYALSAGVRLAAPILIPLAMLTISMGLVSRAFPQANIFSISFGLSMVLGMVLISLSVPLLREGVFELTRVADRSSVRLLQALSGN